MGDKTLKILAIDDIRDNLISLGALIKEAFPEARLFTALNGESGIALAIVEDPDVILLDIVMPGMNGFDVCKKLKSITKLSDIPIVFLTALKGNKESRIRALEAGAEGFLAKPIDESELTAQIRAMAKIKAAHLEKRDENNRLAALVAEQTSELRSAHAATLDLLEEVRRENEARKKSEAKLWEREAFLEKLLETIPVPVFYKDLDGKYSGCNRYYADFFGVNIEDLIGKTVFDIHPPEMARIYHAQDALLLQKPQTQMYESRVQSSKGLVRDAIFHKASITGAQGAVTGLIGVILDITERKRAEDALARSQVELRAIYDHAPVMMCLVSADRRVLYTNPALTAFAAVASDTLNNAHTCRVFGCIHALDSFPGWGGGPQCRDCPLRRAMEDTYSTGKGHYNVEYQPTLLREGNPQQVSLLVSTALIHATDQDLLLLCVHDISERKRAEDERKHLQIQLQQAQKMEAIGTLAGGIAHDFNNILSAIIGYTEMAMDASPSGSGLAKDLSKVLQAGNRAAVLVKQILAFSRHNDTERVVLRPVHIVKEAIKLLRPSLPSTITIRQSVLSSQPILADPTQVHQVLMNLCTNAFHAMEETGGTLDIALKDCELSPQDLVLHAEAQAGRFVELAIGDSGSGIAPEIRNKIFDPYFTTKGVGKGTGMGLAIAHGIVTSSGGFITCESEPGKGTCFHVFFPAFELEAGPEDVSKPEEVALSGKERILFVDDEEMLAELGRMMLQRLGYEVTMRTSSQDALATFRRHPQRFDAVITDQTMPGMTGMELAREIFLIQPEIPVILCTGYSALVNEDRVKAEGIKALAMKPLSKKGIAALLREVLDASSVSAAKKKVCAES